MLVAKLPVVAVFLWFLCVVYHNADGIASERKADETGLEVEPDNHLGEGIVPVDATASKELHRTIVPGFVCGVKR